MASLPLLLASLTVLTLGCGPQRWVKKGDRELSADHPNAAARAYEQALRRDPASPAALKGLAATHLQRQEPAKAILPAQRAVRGGNSSARGILGKAMILTGRAKDAIKVLDGGLSTDPSNHAWRRLKVEATLASGDVQGAAKLSDTLAGIERTSAQAMRAWALSRAGQTEAAAEVAQDMVQMDPKNPSLQAEAAAIFQEAGKTALRDASREVARSSLSSSPSDLLREARFHADGGDIEGAIRKLSWARAIYPLNSEVPRQLGLSYFQQREWRRSIRELSAALSMPPFAKARTIHAVRVAYAGDIGRESRRRSAVVDIATKLGEAHAQLGERNQAASAWQRAVESNPAASTADYVAVAKAWELAGDIDRMGAIARTASKLAPRDPHAQHAMSRALAASGNLEAAIGYGQQAWDLAPRDVSIALHLGDLYERTQDKSAASEVYRSSLSHNPGNSRLLLGLQRVGR